MRVAGQPGYREQFPMSLSSISLLVHQEFCSGDTEAGALSLPRHLSTLKSGTTCLRVGLRLGTVAGHSCLPLSAHCFIVLPF